MFRIDKSSVSYKNQERPYLLEHAALKRPVSVEEAQEELIPDVVLPDIDALNAQAERIRREAQDLLDQARAGAATIVAAAQDEAAGLIAAAKLDAVEMQKSARAEGQAQGYEAGLAEGRAQGEAAYTSAVTKADGLLAAALKRVEAERAGLYEQIEGECVQLAMDIASKIVENAIAFDEAAFPALVRASLTALQHDGKITVHVSPLEYEIFFAQNPARLSDETRAVLVVPDDTLASGDLTMDSDLESINAGVRARMQVVGKTLNSLLGADA